MSLEIFLASVAAAPQARVAYVSASLFDELQHAGAIDVVYHRIKVPSDPRFGKPVEDWLASLKIDPNLPMAVPDHTLAHYPSVHVRIGSHFDVGLAASGQGSYKLT